MNFKTLPGFNQEFPPVRVNVAANSASDVVIATATGDPDIPIIRLLGLTVRSRGSTTADLTHIQVFAGTGKRLTLIDSTDGAQANLDAEAKQVSWNGGQGGAVLATGETIVAELTGTGATLVDFDIAIRYAIINPGATLS